MPEVRLLRETTVLGCYDDNYLIAAERVGERLGPAAPAGLPRQRLWHIRARRVVLATGAIERPLVFPDNDRPGIMLAGAVETYLHRFAVAAGRRAVLFVNNDGAYPLARGAGAGRGRGRGDRRSAARAGRRRRGRLADGIPLYSGHAVVGTAGRRALRRVRVRPAEAPGGQRRGAGGRARSTAICWPYRAAGTRTCSFSRRRAAGCASIPVSRRWCRARARRRSTAPGRRTGIFCSGVPCRGGSGGGAGRRAVRLRRARAMPGNLAAPPDDGANPAAAAPPISACAVRRREAARLCRSAQRRDRRRYRAGGARGLCGPRASEALHDARHGHRPGQDRQPRRSRAARRRRPGRALPRRRRRRSARLMRRCRTGCWPGASVARLADPVRVTPMHDWHVAAGAVFEDVGQWKRARYYPRPGEDMDGGGAARVPRGARPGGAARRLDPGKDRGDRAGRGAVSRPDLYQPLGQSRGRRLPLRRDVPRGRHGVRRRGRDPARRGPVPADDDDRQRRRRARLARGVAADRVDRSRGLLHVGDRGMGQCDPGRAARPRRAAARWRRISRSIRPRSRSCGCARPRWPASRRASSGSVSRANSATRSTCRRISGWRCGSG